MNFHKFSSKFLHFIAVIAPELIGLLGFLALWQLGAMQYNPVILPSPLETFIALKNLVATNRLTDAIFTTIFDTFSGFAIAALSGIFLGIVAGMQPLIRRSLGPILSALQGVPPIAWIAIALLWFGTGNSTPIFTTFVATIPVIFIGAVEGVRNLDSQLLEMAKSFRLPVSALLEDLYLPHLLSSLFPSIAAALGLAWRVAVMSEFLSSERGIGAEMNIARINLDTAEVMALVIVAVVLILISEYLILRPIRRFLAPWDS